MEAASQPMFDSSMDASASGDNQHVESSPEMKGQGGCGILAAVCITFTVLAAWVGCTWLRFRLNLARGVGALVPYVVLQLCTTALAFKLRDCKLRYRWPCGLLCTMVMGTYKSAALMPLLAGGGSFGAKMVVYATGALWECSNASLVFGGSEMQQKFNITTYQRSLIAALAPAQVKFVNAKKPNLTRVRCLHIVLFLVAGFCFRLLLGASSALIAVIESTPILEAECLAIMMSCFLMVFNLPIMTWQIGMDAALTLTKNSECKVEVILPYGAVYFITSTREFWGKWSRPASQLIRQMLFYPLGGKRCPYLAIPLMFLINGASHYDVGQALVGDREVMGWNIVFGTLGLAATAEVLASDFMSVRCVELPVWFKAARGVAAHASLRVGVYVLIRKCLKTSISMFL